MFRLLASGEETDIPRFLCEPARASHSTGAAEDHVSVLSLLGKCSVKMMMLEKRNQKHISLSSVTNRNQQKSSRGAI